MSTPTFPNRSRRQRAAASLTGPVIGALLRRTRGWRGVLVLNYHRVGDHAAQPWDHTLWSASAEGFDAQLAMLSAEAEVIDPGEVEASLRSGRRGRRVLLTFDDGYRDNFELAYPLLRRHGLTATFFLATGFIDSPRVAWWDEIAWMVRHAQPEQRAMQEATIAGLVARYKSLPRDRAEAFLDELAQRTGSGRCPAEQARDLWMTWEMARELRAGGMTIGGHTVTHPVLARVPIDDQEREIAGCAERLERELDEPMRSFAYPVGTRDSFTQETQRLLRERGVQLAFSFYGGRAGAAPPWDPLDVPRVHVGRECDADVMRAMVWLPRMFAR